MKLKFFISTTFILALISISLFSINCFTGATNINGDTLYMQEMSQRYSVYSPEIPDKLYFCNQRVPLENFDVRESLEKEILKTMYWHSEIYLYLKRANRYFPKLKQILKENNVPEDFVYLCVCESGMDNVVSPAKAVGFWQILDITAKEYGLEVNDEVDERYDIEKSTALACKYFKIAKAKFGGWAEAAASYNCGQGGFNKVVTRQQESSYYDLNLNRETGRYVYRILALKLIMENPENYGFCFREKDLYPIIETRSYDVDTAVTSWPDFAHTMGSNYKMLKTFNPWIRDYKLTNKNRKLYKVVLPTMEARSREYKVKKNY